MSRIHALRCGRDACERPLEVALAFVGSLPRTPRLRGYVSDDDAAMSVIIQLASQVQFVREIPTSASKWDGRMFKQLAPYTL